MVSMSRTCSLPQISDAIKVSVSTSHAAIHAAPHLTDMRISTHDVCDRNRQITGHNHTLHPSVCMAPQSCKASKSWVLLAMSI